VEAIDASTTSCSYSPRVVVRCEFLRRDVSLVLIDGNCEELYTDDDGLS
jgi:hypothetical protein